MRRPRPRRNRRALAAAAVALALGTAVACRATSPEAGPATTTHAGAATFEDVDAAMETRLRDDGIGDGALLVARDDGTVVHQRLYGDATGGEVLPVASASKWLTAATLLTLVDDGRLSLDEPVARWLPAFGGGSSGGGSDDGGSGDGARITLRHLLSHTSGIAQDDCIWDRETTLGACVDEIAGQPLVARPGEAFRYGNTSFHVAARVGEVASGRAFQDLFLERIARPLGMTDTRFDGGRPTDNPSPAASASTTVADYGRFLRMLANGGQLDGRRVLSSSSVAELERDQVAGLDTRRDPAVRITGVPTYGLGLWRDVVDDQDRAVVVSGSGSLGFYPWIDHRHGTYGMVAVADEAHADGHAVQASQRIARLAVDATATASPTAPATTGVALLPGADPTSGIGAGTPATDPSPPDPAAPDR